MSNLNLKTITFPELDNTYEIAVQPDGNYDNLTAGTALAVLSDSYTEDAVPYKFRRTPYKSRRLMDSITGGTVAWNQLCNGASVSVPNGHKYLSKIADAWTIGASTGAAITGLTAGADMVIDLTQMFGTTIADYIYSLETATAGAGVSLFRSLFGASYYPYNAGELISISGLSEHKTTGKNLFSGQYDRGSISATGGVYTYTSTDSRVAVIPCQPNTEYTAKKFETSSRFIICSASRYPQVGDVLTRYSSPASNPYTFTTDADAQYIVICVTTSSEKQEPLMQVEMGSTATDYEPYEAHTYPLDASLTLRGVPKLDSNNRLYFDGDIYAPDGTVTRRYGIIDLGTLSWTYYSGEGHIRFYATLPVTAKGIASGQEIPNLITVKYIADTYYNVFNDVTDKTISVTASGQQVAVYDTAYTDAATFKTAMSGVYLLYELATETTETADPFINPQYCSANGTEEYISETVVPVGHESRYYRDIIGAIEDIPDLPTTAGNYVLKVTVSGGVPVYSWVTS